MKRVGAVHRISALVGEGLAIARTQWMPTTVTALVVAAVVAVVLSTVGQSAAVEAHILGSFEEAGTRTITITDPTGEAEILADSIQALGSLQGVAWALGLGPVTDVRNADLGAAGRPVASRPVYGSLPTEMSVSGRLPTNGEALVGSLAMTVLGLQYPAGAVAGDNREFPVVGEVTASDPLSFLNTGIAVIQAPELSPGARLREIVVVATDAEAVPMLVEAIRQVVHARTPSAISIEAPTALAELREAVTGELATSSRRLMVVVLGVGLVIIGVTLAGAVAQRWRDFGRRRALGASRSAIILLVLTHTLAGGILGAIIGCLAGLVAVWRFVGFPPNPAFVAAVGVLGVLVAAVASVAPGVAAAFRDPVRILRVP